MRVDPQSATAAKAVAAPTWAFAACAFRVVGDRGMILFSRTAAARAVGALSVTSVEYLRD